MIKKPLHSLITVIIVAVIAVVAVVKVTSIDRVINYTHPYNECLDIFIKESTKNGKECDFKEAKSICFDLIKSDGK